LEWTYEVPHSRDSTFSSADTSDTIHDFMTRPVLVKSINWIPGVTLSVQFNPWELYFEDPRVLARIANFRNLRCDMQIKILINGNPFYYGRAIASYVPIPDNDERSVVVSPDTPYFIQKSQRPHIYINPTDSTGGDLLLPYFYPKDALSVVGKEWRRMGILSVEDMVVLRHANEGTDGIAISIFAMPCNLQLSTPTSRIPFTNESDEYLKPSAVAHSIANASAQLANVPTIGPYMRATSMIATRVGDIASLFGYSRPREIRESQNFRNRPVSNLSSTNVPDNVGCLSLDSKKEITIDPRVVGLPGNDEMALLPIAMRESYLCQVVWSETMSTGTHLRSIKVTPVQGDIVNASTYVLSPSAYTTLPFKYWKGTMTLRMTVVASAYHRGRLKVVWDPEYNSASDAGIYNTNYTQIIDISQNKEVVMDIGWGQTTTYLESGGLSFPSFSSTPYTSRDPFANGVVSVYVLNDLTTPAPTAASAPVTVLFHTSFCEDYDVACPDSSIFEAGITITKTVPTSIPLPVPPVSPTTPSFPPSPSAPAVVPLNGIALGTYTPGFVAWIPAFPTNTTSGLTQSTGAVASLDFALSSNPSGTTASINSQVQFLSGSHVLKIEAVNISTGQVISSLTRTLAAGLQDLNFSLNVQTANGMNRIRFTNMTNSDVFTLVKFGVQNVKYTTMLPSAYTLVPSGGGATASLSGDVWSMSIPSSSQYVRVVLPTQTTGNVMVHYNCRNASGETITCGMEYNDGTVVVLSSQAFAMNGTIPNQLSYANGTYFPAVSGKVGVALRFSSINASPATPKISTIIYSAAAIQNQSEDTGDAPVAEDSSIVVAPPTYGSLANHVYFGEQVTSWRQLLKRYVECAYFSGSSITQVLTEVTGDTGISAGPLVLNRLHPMDYARSAYVGYRGSWRLRLLTNPKTSGGYTGRVLLYRPNFLESQSSIFNIYPKWDGSTYDPINLSGTSDAEIPYYSRFRFLPARLTGSLSSTTPLDTTDLARQRMPVVLSLTSTLDMDVSCLKAIAEDFSLHFFLSTPCLTLA